MGNVGDSMNADNAGWKFSDNVCQKFDEHITKSVPFYTEGHKLVERISDYFLNEGSTCYDIGCSTGSLIGRLANRHRDRNVKLIGLDVEQDMASKAHEKFKAIKNVEIINGDALDVELNKSDLIISYYTMQFVKPKDRQILFNRIYEALNWGGAFLLFEKVRGPDARFQDMMTGIYTDYKLDAGYTEEEIVSKARSLKGVLEPFSSQGNIDLMKRAGFVDVMSVMKYVCFEGFLAIK